MTATALLLVCPVLEPAVADERARLDRAAQDGVPAHLTVIYPFKLLERVTEDDHHRLEALAAGCAPFSVVVGRSGWFGDEVVYLAPDDPEPVALLIRRVWSAFPDFPPYGGSFADPVPHVTVGHAHPLAELQAAERSIVARLPLTQRLDHLELWAGPDPEGRTEPEPWRRIRDYPLDRPA